MSTIESVKTQIQTLIEQANTTTGVTSTDLTSAVNILREGYGQGDSSGGITPSGSLDITENGTYDVTNYASVNVNVVGESISRTRALINRSITDVISVNATSVGNSAFSYCSALTSVVFHNATSIGNNAFNTCTKLARVDLHNATSIGNNAFRSLTSLTSVILRSTSVVTIKGTSFYSSSIENGTGYVYVPSALINSYKTASEWRTYASQIRAIEDYPDICGGGN